MGKGDPSEYRLRFFEDNGFVRKRCRVCGSYFWTLDPERTVCEDVPCVSYRFHKIPRRVGRLGVRDVRRRFIRFFEENGHSPVKPRPVVARWRDDLYLTIASIIVFQPFVTSGVVPPPANPLVISQPCIRLEDIDNVGITFGRHLTSFEMAAHHAFNYPDKQVYWKDRTVELAFRFFTEEIGIPPEELVFKESWWEGGGNAGPSFEVTVGGLELATLVFMQYEVVNGEYRPIPLRIVDTGYGVERIAWFTQPGAYTAFDAIYGELVDRFRRILGVKKPSRELMERGLVLAGRLDPEDQASIERFYEALADETGRSPSEVRGELARQTALYGLLDHSKTLALMLGDGIVPSNSGEGYLARLVLRRAMRLIRRLGSDASLVDLVSEQIRLWSGDFPRLLEHRDYILDAVAYEEERYRQTLEKGASLVRRMLRKKKKLELDDLVVLYESHGVPPDLVAEEASKQGYSVQVPPNFYSIVASRHKAPGMPAKKRDTPGLPPDLVRWASRFPETRRLFHEDPYARRFTATILGVWGDYVVLDQTAFYPRGGGQDADTGYLLVNGEKLRVLDTVKAGGVVLHKLEKKLGGGLEGRRVEGEIDWERRYTLMRHHTATHVIMGAARRVLGEHVWQAGAEKTVEKARLDITHHRPLTKEQVRMIERLANAVVLQRRPVRTFMMERNKAEETYGFRIYQGGVPPDPIIRVVEIESWDVQACFGTHLANTGEIGAVKIIGVDKIQDGVIRLEYVAGTRVAEEYEELEKAASRAAELLGASPRSLHERLARMLEDRDKERRLLEEYRKAWITASARRILGEAEDLGGMRFYAWMPEIGDPEAVREVLRKVTGEHGEVALAAVYRVGGRVMIEVAAGRRAVEAGFDSAGMLKRLLASLGGRGGGRKEHATGYAEAEPEAVVREAWRAARSMFASR